MELSGMTSQIYSDDFCSQLPSLTLSFPFLSAVDTSGILSAVSLLLAKSAVELLIRTIINGNNQFTRWQSWAILLGLVSAALSQLYFLHRGLKLCSTSVLYPLVFCVYNIFAILDGIIYYNQANRLSSLSAWLVSTFWSHGRSDSRLHSQLLTSWAH